MATIDDISTLHGLKHLEDLIYMANSVARDFDRRLFIDEETKVRDDDDLQRLKALHCFESTLNELWKQIIKKRQEIEQERKHEPAP